MNLAVLTICDGREDVHRRSIDSLKESAPEPEHHIVIDDTDHKLGFSGAIQAGWAQIRETDAEWVLHHEADFIFHEPIAVDRMVAVLERRPELAQLVLKRQPINDSEQPDLVGRSPSEYRQVTDRGDIWTEHRLNWSTNPCIYPAAFCAQGWPPAPGSERAFSDRLLEDPEVRFAYWGAKTDEPRCEHIGHTRTGTGY